MHRAYQRRYGQRKRFMPSRRTIIYGLCAFLGVFIAVNVVLAATYHDRTYPRTRIMNTTIGSVPYSQLAAKVNELQILPLTVKLKAGDQQQNASLAELGISKDIDRTVGSAREQRSWLPIVNLFKSPQLKAPVTVEDATLQKVAAKLVANIHKDAVSKHLDIQEGRVNIASAQNGFKINESRLKDSLLAGLDKGKTVISLAVISIPPKPPTVDLKQEQSKLQAQINTKITFHYGSQSKQIADTEIANRWFVPAGEIYAISSENLRNYIISIGQEFGITINNADQAVADTTSALQNHQDADITLTKQVAEKVYKYCTAARGVNVSNLPTLRTKLASVYADARGWSLGGLVEFDYATSGCDFTVWLSANDQMTSFGGVCDVIWSCRSGDNVVINFDRWSGASDSWNAHGGTLEDYRVMVINHETGHRLGFDHDHCGGAGQPAPLMQQQSIDLHGCTFNPWPLPKETAELKARLGL